MSTSKRRRETSELVIDDGQLMSDSSRDYFDVIVRGRSSNNQQVIEGEGGDDSHSQVAAERMSSDGYNAYNRRVSQQHQRQNHARNPPRSSWLCHVDWLVSSSDEEQRRSLPQPQSNNVEAGISDAMNEEEEENPSIQDAIRSLSIQLLQVKRRMFPAAERCAEAYNSLYSDHRLTTARKEFTMARNACNPYEILTRGGGGRNHHSGAGGLGHLFLNRAGIKLANIDAIIDLRLTNHHCHQDGGTAFVFVDLCGAPGGFSEYILWRCRRRANSQTAIPACRGYGMSLQGSNEYGGGTPWKLQEFSQVEHGTYLQYRICEGADGTGDVYRWENVEALRDMMMADCCEQPRLKTPSSSTEGEHGHDDQEVGKAHLILADGGFDAQRDSEHQEEVAQKLIICEVAAGLALLRVGGTLVIKMFGFQTEVIRALIRDLDSMFHQLVAVKPISSRPASAERYLVCTNFQGLPAPGWDGRKWISRMFLGLHGQPQQQQLSRRVVRYLDQFDCDMLGLNLKACFHVLSFLESKCLAATTNAGQSNSFDSDFSSTTSDFTYSNNNANESIVDIEAYKRAWQLV